MPSSEFSIMRFIPKNRLLTDDEKRMYALIDQYWGTIPRTAMFRLLGLQQMDSDSRRPWIDSLASALGNQLVNIVVLLRLYLVQWPAPPLIDVLFDTHYRLNLLVPKMYQLAALLLSSTPLTKNKDFKSVIVLALDLCTSMERIFTVLRKIEPKSKRFELASDLYVASQHLRKSITGIYGRDEKTSLLIRGEE